MNKPGMKDGVLTVGTVDPHAVYRTVSPDYDRTLTSLVPACPIRKTNCTDNCAWYSDGKCAIDTGIITEGKCCPFTSQSCYFNKTRSVGEPAPLKQCAMSTKDGCKLINCLRGNK